MDDECTKFFVLETRDKDSKFKHIKFDNTFYEPQMKVGKPTYFSPNFHYRLYIDQERKAIVLGSTLMNMECLALSGELRKQLMYQKAKSHPMIYFHDNDKIVYLTTLGVEKVFEIVKKQKKKRTIFSLKEVANCYYNKRDLVQRVLFDGFNFKRELAS